MSFFHPIKSEDSKQKIKNKYTHGNDYFIFIGTLHPRKNIVRLMQAFDLFKTETSNNLKLVLAGKEMYRTSELHYLKTRLTNGDDIIFTGRLPDKELADLLAASYCMVFIPLFEGFGLPLVEAMQCNIPVIASNVTSVPEVVGDAGLLINPYNVDEIKNAMIKIYKNDSLRQSLIQKGKTRSNSFMWKQTAALLWSSMNKCLER